jgi:hypothetical protein
MPRTHEEFLAAYMASSGIAAMTAPIPIAAANSHSETISSTSRHFGRSSITHVNAGMNVDTSPEDQNIVKVLSKVYRSLELAMIVPWTMYLDMKGRLEIASALKKLNTEYFTIEATEGATMDVDNEDSTTPSQLQELVRKQPEANTKSLQQELNTLQQQIKGLKTSSAKKRPEGPIQRLATNTKRSKRPRKSQV